jgi:hypothetical protein
VCLFRPFFFWSSFLFPNNRYISYQRPNIWADKADLYEEYDSTVLVAVSLIPPCATFLCSDKEAFGKVLEDNKSFEKTVGCVNK